MKPGVSHIGQTTRTMRPLAGLGLTGGAWTSDRVSTSNGSASSASSGAGPGFGFVRALAGPGPAAAFAVWAGFAADVVLAAFVGAGFGLAEGLPDIEAPQKGQSSTSSSRTEALQAGQVRKSMVPNLNGSRTAGEAEKGGQLHCNRAVASGETGRVIPQGRRGMGWPGRLCCAERFAPVPSSARAAPAAGLPNPRHFLLRGTRHDPDVVPSARSVGACGLVI